MVCNAESVYCRMRGKVVMSNARSRELSHALSLRSPCKVHVLLVLCRGVGVCHTLSGLHSPHAGRVGGLSAGQAEGRGAAVRRGRGARRAAGSEPFYPLEEFLTTLRLYILTAKPKQPAAAAATYAHGDLGRPKLILLVVMCVCV